MKYYRSSVLSFLVLSILILHSSNAFTTPSRKGCLVPLTKMTTFPPKGWNGQTNLQSKTNMDDGPTRSVLPNLQNFWCNNNKKDNRHWATWMTSILVFVSTFGYPNVVTAMENGPTTTATTATSTSGSKSRYYSIMEEGSLEDRRKANGALFDWMVGTINTQYYDQTGGAVFSPKEFYHRWKHDLPSSTLDTREDAVNGLKWLVQSMNDPYSKYLTQQELKEELTKSSSSELESTIGILVEQQSPSSSKTATASKKVYNELMSKKKWSNNNKNTNTNNNNILSTEFIQQHSLPMVTAVIPDSLAERNGIVVGDYVISIGNDSSISSTKSKIRNNKFPSTKDENDSEVISMTMAKPIMLSVPSSAAKKDVILGYRVSHVQLHNHHTTENSYSHNMDTTTTVSMPYNSPSTTNTNPIVSGGNSIVHYQLLTPQQSLLFSSDFPQDKVGYIRLTRFSRSATEGYMQAIKALEQAGAQSYIIDIRNNYGMYLVMCSFYFFWKKNEFSN